MGLDMFLKAKVSLYLDDALRTAVHEALAFPNQPVPFGAATYVEFEAAYWRKANHIHKWFVNNVQDGVDNCGEYWVSPEKLKVLRDLCARVLEEHTDEAAQELLPPTSGFFFGGILGDEWYWNATDYTKTRIDELLAAHEDWSARGRAVEFYYRSSW